jgi:hypothetical protein
MDRTIALRESVGLHAARGSAQPLAFFRSGNVSLACVPSRRPYRFSRPARSSENSPAADSFRSRALAATRQPHFSVAPDRLRRTTQDKARAAAEHAAIMRSCRGCFRFADDKTPLISESATAKKSSPAPANAARRSPNARVHARTVPSDNSEGLLRVRRTASRETRSQHRRSSR